MRSEGSFQEPFVPRKFPTPHGLRHIRLPLFLVGNKIVEDLGPSFLEVSVPLEPPLHHGLYSVLGFGPCQRCATRSEGIEEPVGRRQRNLVDQILRGDEGSSIKGG